VEKPWGYELIWARSDRYCGKLLFVRAGEALSLQFHEAKDETIYVHEGRVEIEMGESARDRVIEVVERGRAFRVRPGIVHRMRALADTTFFEASTPELDDVVRLEDRYGRTSGLAER
ncbi:MAG: cupin domain-containing protein, partial [Actinomycetota bacterium]|nr:cupin domain-containing protein [Actinomycetota bacterium]